MPSGSTAEEAGGRHLVARAPAKINLGLALLGRRPDGYHDLRTLFVALDLEDRLRFRPRDDGEIRLTVAGDPSIPAGEENLVVRAARRVAGLRAPGRGADIHLEKRIPAGAGLGGGSSDAAATILALETLWDLPPEPALNREIALEVGSDVPFFLVGGMARGEGRGERLTPLDGVPRWPVVLAVPGFGVSTRDAYAMAPKALTGSEGRLSMLEHAVAGGDLDALGRLLVNDLEAGVFRLHPELVDLRDRLLDHGLDVVGMTGSGSSLFGLVRDDARLERFVRKAFATGEAPTSPGPRRPAPGLRPRSAGGVQAGTGGESTLHLYLCRPVKWGVRIATT